MFLHRSGFCKFALLIAFVLTYPSIDSTAMSVLINKNTRVLVQGITGSEGTYHASQMLEYGTNVVAGVTPGKGGTDYHPEVFNRAVPVFNTVSDAVTATGATAWVIFAPAAFAADAIREAADAGIALVICITEGIP